MRRILAAVWVSVFIVAGSGAVSAQDCPWWRPCGPGNTWGGNLLFKQGFHGADFRPACQNHDNRLASGMYSRAQVDRMFLDDMYCACDSSSHPILCRMKARHYYIGARLFGGFYYPGL